MLHGQPHEADCSCRCCPTLACISAGFILCCAYLVSSFSDVVQQHVHTDASVAAAVVADMPSSQPRCCVLCAYLHVIRLGRMQNASEVVSAASESSLTVQLPPCTNADAVAEVRCKGAEYRTCQPVVVCYEVSIHCLLKLNIAPGTKRQLSKTSTVKHVRLPTSNGCA
jgi:hypothetical protein